MKNSTLNAFLTVLCVSFLAGSLTGCFDEDLGPPTYEGAPQLQFLDESRPDLYSATVFDGSGMMSINVQLIAETGTLEEDHQFGVMAVDSLSNVSSSNYEILTPAPVIAADSVFSEVQVAIDEGDIPPGENRVLTLGLQPSEDGVVEVAPNFQFYEIFIVGREARIATTPGSVAFGEVMVGSTATDTVTISNLCATSSCDGALPSSISDLQITGDENDVFDIVSDAAFDLGPNDTQSVIIEFTPEGFESYAGTLTFSGTNDADQTEFELSLAGTGVSDSEDTSFGAFDADEDGTLDATEFNETLRRSGAFGAFDADDSADVDSTEFATGVFAAFDSDADDILDPAEFSSGADAFLSDDADFGDFDADSDGAVTFSEFNDSLNASEDLFAGFDPDGDGLITADEFNGAFFGLADTNENESIDDAEFGAFTPLLGL